MFRLQVSRPNMSVSSLAPDSTLEVNDKFTSRSADHQRVLIREVASVSEQSRETWQPRKVCTRCWKPASRCICAYIKTVVKNKTAITILQHPDERKHHLGSARIALLGLQTVELISFPVTEEQTSCRIRPKVTGSKRFLAGRGGKKAELLVENDAKNEAIGPGKVHFSDPEVSPPAKTIPQSSLALASGETVPGDGTTGPSEDEHSWSTIPAWLNLRPDAGLLFPSEKALDLWPHGLRLGPSSESELNFQSELASFHERENGVPNGAPSQLIVLDGTWSKAKRIFFQNPWLNSLPHYKLPTLQPSRYGTLRPEPKPGFLSTVESIVYALQLLEPETKGLLSLLDVFDSMIDDQVNCLAALNKLGRIKHVSRGDPHKEEEPGNHEE